jgi:hypothetical protein
MSEAFANGGPAVPVVAIVTIAAIRKCPVGQLPRVHSQLHTEEELLVLPAIDAAHRAGFGVFQRVADHEEEIARAPVDLFEFRRAQGGDGLAQSGRETEALCIG